MRWKKLETPRRSRLEKGKATPPFSRLPSPAYRRACGAPEPLLRLSAVRVCGPRPCLEMWDSSFTLTPPTENKCAPPTLALHPRPHAPVSLIPSHSLARPLPALLLLHVCPVLREDLARLLENPHLFPIHHLVADAGADALLLRVVHHVGGV